MNLDSVEYFIQVAATVAFAVTAVLAVTPKGIDLFGACVMGIITAVGGGLIRDVLAGRQTLLMSREIYAVPVLFGTLSYVVVLELFPQHGDIGALACFGLIFAMRTAAIRWSLSVPAWLTTKPSSPDPSSQ